MSFVRAVTSAFGSGLAGGVASDGGLASASGAGAGARVGSGSGLAGSEPPRVAIMAITPPAATTPSPTIAARRLELDGRATLDTPATDDSVVGSEAAAYPAPAPGPSALI